MSEWLRDMKQGEDYYRMYWVILYQKGIKVKESILSPLLLIVVIEMKCREMKSLNVILQMIWWGEESLRN